MKSCLVVDDSKVVRHVARRIVEELGFEVEEAEDGQVALDCCLRRMPYVVLLDWNMPVMNGMDFLLKLRATEGGDAPFVVFLTTENTMPKIQEAIGAGANEYIMKPFDSEIVADKFKLAGVL